MPQKERMRVWKGELKKTSGGLTKGQLVKNKRGKIVSLKKSTQAVGDENNLGSWLRGKGDKFAGKPKGYEKDEKEEEKMQTVAPKKTKPKPKPRPPPPKARPPPPKQPKKKKKVAVVDLTDSPVKAAPPPKKKKKKKVAPMVAGEKKEYGKLSVGNIIVPPTGKALKEQHDKSEMLARKQMKDAGFSQEEIDGMFSGGGLSLAAKVRRRLKASKRRGKRRTKKQLLRDVLDL